MSWPTSTTAKPSGWVRGRRQPTRGACIALKANVRPREDEVSGLFACALERFGSVTGLVNNAGLTAYIGDLADTPVEVIRRVIDVNLLGVVLCARQAAKVMARRRGGRGGAVVNVSSAAATLRVPP